MDLVSYSSVDQRTCPQERVVDISAGSYTAMTDTGSKSQLRPDSCDEQRRVTELSLVVVWGRSG